MFTYRNRYNPRAVTHLYLEVRAEDFVREHERDIRAAWERRERRHAGKSRH